MRRGSATIAANLCWHSRSFAFIRGSIPLAPGSGTCALCCHRARAWARLVSAMLPRILSSAMVLALGVAAQADQVVISEIMYHPRADWPEFIEVFNNTATVFDVAGWKLSGGVQYEFPDFSPADPAASLLHSFERIVLSEAGPEATRTAYHLSLIHISEPTRLL